MRHETLKPKFVEHIPEELQEGVIYVSRKFETAVHLCACGACGNQTVTPFNQGGWSIHIENDKSVTLSPSIGNWQFPCKSHYFIRDNRVEWC